MKKESISNGKIDDDDCCALNSELNTCKNSSWTCDCSSSMLHSTTTDRAEKQQTRYGALNRSINNPRILIILGLSLTIPIVLLQFFDSPITDYASLILSTPVQIILGRPFYIRFFRSLMRRKWFTTDALVVLSTTVAYCYGFVALFSGQNLHFSEASASVLVIFTIGEYLEQRVIRSTNDSLKKLFELKPKTATIITDDGIEQTIDADQISLGDIVVTKSGERIATDGVVVNGESSVDESMISGESLPVDKIRGDKVIGGTVNKLGYLKFRATSVGSDTVLSHIVETVEKARLSKAPIQRLTDKGVKYFVPIVLSIAAISSLYWLIIAQQSIAFAVTVFATVLVVSCPCALGIATPMVVSLGIDRAAKHGVLIKGGQYLEKLGSINTVVFDKTGTLTKNIPKVTDIIVNDGFTELEILKLASSAEAKSEHPIAQAIVAKALDLKITPAEVSEFVAISGRGVVVKHREEQIFVVSPAYGKATLPPVIQHNILKLESEGKTVVAVYRDNQLVGIIAIADSLRDNAEQIIHEIKKSGRRVILLTGDNERTALYIANQLRIEDVIAGVLPEEKGEKIKTLQDQGSIVAMVGDGINDAPALTRADVGIAMGSGTDIAAAAGHVILMKSDLQGVLFALNSGKSALKKIKQNLAISFAYNIIAISIATGILHSITHSLVLTPEFAALGWIISDSTVFGNSLLMRKPDKKLKAK